MNERVKRLLKDCNKSTNESYSENNDKENKVTTKKVIKKIRNSSTTKQKEKPLKNRVQEDCSVEYFESSRKIPNIVNKRLQDINNGASTNEHQIQNMQSWKNIMTKPLTDVSLTHVELKKLFEKYKMDGHYRANSELPPFTIFLGNLQNKCKMKNDCFDSEMPSEEIGQQDMKYIYYADMNQNLDYQVCSQREETNKNYKNINYSDMSSSYLGRMFKEQNAKNIIDNRDHYVQQSPLTGSYIQDYVQCEFNSNQTNARDKWFDQAGYVYHNIPESNIGIEEPYILECNNTSEHNIFNKQSSDTSFLSHANTAEWENLETWVNKGNSFDNKPSELNNQSCDIWVPHPIENNPAMYTGNAQFLVNCANEQNDCISYNETIDPFTVEQPSSCKLQCNTISVSPVDDSCVPVSNTSALVTGNFSSEFDSLRFFF